MEHQTTFVDYTLLEMKGATGDTPAASAAERALSKLKKWTQESVEPGDRINPIATMKMDRNGLCYGGRRECMDGCCELFGGGGSASSFRLL